MKKKNNAQGTFAQRFLACLSKLKDNATIATAHQQIRQLLQEHDLQDISNIYQLLDATENVTDKARKEYVKVYTSLCEVYGPAVFDTFERMLVSLFRKVQFGPEVAEVVSTLAQLFQDFDYDQQIRCSEMLLKHITSTTNYGSMGLCLRALVRSLSRTMVAYFEDFIVELVLEKLPHSKQKQQLLEALLSLMLALEEDFSSRQKISGVLLALIKDEDWNVRRVAVDIYYTIIVLKGLDDNKDILRAVQEAKYDKIKNVRDAATNCLNVIKQFGGAKESPRFVEQLQSKTKTPARATKTFSKHDPTPKINSSAARPHSKSTTASNQRVIKNESFFKNAKQNDVILTSKQENIQPPQKDVSGFTLAKKFTFQDEPSRTEEHPAERPSLQPAVNNYMRQHQNDSLEHLTNMIPVSFGEHEKPTTSPKDSLQLSNYDYGSNKSHQQLGLSKWKRPLVDMSKTELLEDIMEIPSRNSLVGVEQDEHPEIIVVDKKEHSNREEPSVSWLAQQLKKVLEKVVQSEDKILGRISALQGRMAKVETRLISLEEKNLRESQRGAARLQTASEYDQSRVKLYLTDHNESAAAIESNVDDKVRASLSDGNLTEAYGLALANNKQDTLIKLIEKTGMVADRLEVVHVQVLILKLKELLTKKIRVVLCLKWIKEFLEADVTLTRTSAATINSIVEHYHPHTSEEHHLLDAIRKLSNSRNG